MSQEDMMKLAAEVVDKFSGPLKDLQAKLKATHDVAAKGSHQAGPRTAKGIPRASRDDQVVRLRRRRW
jgi:hypothetical protein